MAFKKPLLHRNSINESTMKNIRYLIHTAGYGWSKYASSVLEQGWASRRQECTLSQMRCHVENFQYQSNESLDYSEAVDYGGIGPTW